MPLGALTIFGLVLGEPLSLPECARDAILKSYAVRQSETCQEIWTGPQPHKAWDQQLIIFPLERAPLIAGTTIGTMIKGGRLIGVTFSTLGIEDQDEVLRQLTTKYGKPTTLSRRKVSTAAGAEFEALTATWDLPSGMVLFDSAPSRIDRGRVDVLTTEAKRLRDEERAEVEGTRTPL